MVIPDAECDSRRGTLAYAMGMDVYGQEQTCPFRVGDDRRIDWWVGWLDARTRARLRGIIEKDWPGDTGLVR